MRHLTIILLNFEHVFEQRARALVWFLVGASVQLPLMVFWWGAAKHTVATSLNTYYLFLIIFGSLLSSHIEEDVYDFDIMQGDLVRYLIKPFSYYWIKLFEEFPYRLLQGAYGLVGLSIFLIFFRGLLTINFLPNFIFLGIVSCILAYFISFTYKISLGLLAFWFQDMRGLMQFLEIITIIFAGFILPLNMFPPILRNTAYFLPFASMIYFPVTIMRGSLFMQEAIGFLAAQAIWLVIFITINRIIWHYGVKEFTGFGQ